MVLTRLSHVGEVCPLGDHSYTDLYATTSSQSQAHSSRRVALVAPKDPPKEPPSSPVVIYILDLPTEIIEKIFKLLTFKKVGDLRKVCKRFEQIGASLLNCAFQRLQSQSMTNFQATKAQMPRRESARRKHPLARESEIFETIHMRLTLLQMTFGKHIERKYCCFFAGEILDEVYRILRCLKSTSNMNKVFKITEELSDLSLMAMEYFKDHIQPILPELTYFGTNFVDLTTRYSSSDGGSPVDGGRISEGDDDLQEKEALPPSNIVLRKRIRRIKQGMKKYNTQLATLKRELNTCKNKVNEQNQQIAEYTSRLEEYDRKFDESARKFSTVLQELNNCKTELQYWRSKSPMPSQLCYNCASTNIPNSNESIKNEDSLYNFPSYEAPHICGRVTYGAGTGVTYPLYSSMSQFQPNTPSSSVKNLEPLFDISPAPSLCNLDTFDPSITFEPTSMSDTPRSLPIKGSGDPEWVPVGIGGSSDDNSEDDDTVGRRVKERKRIKLEGGEAMA